MALPGMRSTGDYGTGERPKNWREGIILQQLRNGASLFRLTGAMRSAPTDDPEFNWWNEEQQFYVFQVNGAQTNVDTALEIDSGGLKLKPGDMLRNERTLEMVGVTAVASDTAVTIVRAVGAGGTPAGTAAAMNDDDKLLYIGSAYREGAPKSIGTSFNPTKAYNFTQIFRDPVEWTRTAMKTRLRTGDGVKEDKRRTFHKHQLGIERSLWLGSRTETLEAGQPKRTTGGVLDFIDPANVQAVSGGTMDMNEFESYFARIFAYGSGEKLAYTSLKVLTLMSKLVRLNTNYQWQQGGKEYGMNVTRFVTPAGTLVLTEHPLFGVDGGFLSDSMAILDTEQLRWRYITDTTYRKDIQVPGDDGKTDEWLTEGGLEFGSPKHHFLLTGISAVTADA